MWDLPDLIKSSDYTVYSSSAYQGILDRLFYDKSIPDFLTYPAHVYKVNFGDGLSVDFEIYSEFTQEEASNFCLLYTSPSPRDLSTSRMPSSA